MLASVVSRKHVGQLAAHN